VAKLDAAGQQILFSPYLGDASIVADFSVAVRCVQADRDGNIVVASAVTKALLPTVNAVQTTVVGHANLYLFKLASDGSRLISATYFGGSGWDNPVSLAIDDQGAAYVLGRSSNSPDFPTTPGALRSSAYGLSAVAKFSPDGGTVLYSATFPWVCVRQPLRVDANGVAVLVSNDATLTLAADGSQLDQSPFPQWVLGLYPWISIRGSRLPSAEVFGSRVVSPTVCSR
jgi:hypothetical protein